MLGTVDLTDGTKGAILGIYGNGLLAFLVHPDHIHGTTVDTYPAAITLIFINAFNSHDGYLLARSPSPSRGEGEGGGDVIPFLTLALVFTGKPHWVS
jgi:hypothetical protein